MKSEKPFVIGITGGSASGKTFLLNKLLSAFSEKQVCLLSQDNYYIPWEQQPLDEIGVKNFDTLESIDNASFISDIKKLLKDQVVTRKEYTFNNPAKKPQQMTFQPAPIIVAEGLFIFNDPSLVELLDLKVFVEAKDHIKLTRRILRDNEERGYDLDDVLYRYEKHVIPTYEKHIEPYKHEADLIIPNNRHFETAVQVLVEFLNSIIAD